MQKDDVARIAAGLTEAQRLLVLGSEPGAFGDPSRACGLELRGAGDHSAAKALERKGLGHILYYDNMNALWLNSDESGLAVRNYLTENHDDQ